jgi:predicted dehydrogenase
VSRARGAHHVLVVGAGSVGKRHLTNFADQGCRVSVVDPRDDRRVEAAAQVAIEGSYPELSDALASAPELSGVVVASPPSFHVEQAIAAIERDLPVLLEKPVSPDAASAVRLARTVDRASVPLLLGYTYRWWPAMQALRRRTIEGDIGRVLHVSCTLSAHLADWHPWERYQDFFMARRDLGGGALLDESHFIDLMVWFFGMPERVLARIARLSDLEIDCDDNVDAMWAVPGGPDIVLHLDLYGRPHDRRIVLRGTEGTLEWTFAPNAIRIGRSGEGDWQVEEFREERNEMFAAVASEFLDVIDGKPPSCSVHDGVAVLHVIEAMRASSRDRAETAVR